MHLLNLITPLFIISLTCSHAQEAVKTKNQPKLIQSGYKFTEGAALAPNGDIYFNDIPNNKTYKYTPKSNELTLHRSDTGAANGLMFNAEGELIYCEGSNRQVTKESAKGIEVIAKEFNGKKLNSPNDLAMDKLGGIFFTDPRYGPKDNVEQDSEGVYYVSKDGQVKRLISNLKKPNGIALHTNQSLLYVADNGTGKIHAYDVKYPDITLSNERIVTDQAPVNDGFKLDEKGNLWVTTSEGVKVFTPEGKHLETIIFPETPANLVFGPKGSKTIYVNARTSFYKVNVEVDGQ